jgi:hypothetical protein
MSSCDSFLLSGTIAELGADPICEWGDGARSVTV